MKIFRILVVFLLQIILVISNIANFPTNKDFDLIIKNGRIIDGTGNPWFYGDIAIKNGKIAEIGRIAPERANRIINATGKVVTPGFIDVHGHLEGNIEN